MGGTIGTNLLVIVLVLLLGFMEGSDETRENQGGVSRDSNNSDLSPPVIMKAVDWDSRENNSWVTRDYTYKIPRWPNGTRFAPLLPYCRLIPASHRDHLAVTEMLQQDLRLIEYYMSVLNYTENPLEKDNHWTYKMNIWSRIVSAHGQTILNLAFNYNILSLMTLTFGVSRLNIDFRDEPFGCTGNLSEHEKVQAILDITIRDLNNVGSPRVIEGKSGICHQVIKINDGAVKFTDRCCYRKLDKDEIECYIDIPNRWLRLLDFMMALLVGITFVFGPLVVPNWLYTASQENENYVVKLKEPLYKNVCVCRRDFTGDIKAKHKLDLRNRKDFVLCRRILSDLPSDMIVPIKISQFDIQVAYRKLLTEEHVPVGIVECISRALFLCKLKELEPFNDCCEASYLGCLQNKLNDDKPRSWIQPCNIIGRMLLVLVLPIPFYVRLTMYYVFEHPEIINRYNAALNIGLPVHHNFRLMQYLTPTHPLFIAAYITYLTAGMIFAYCSTKSTKTHFQQAIIDAFAELTDMSFLNALGMVIRNLLLPFRKYGIFGIVCGCIFWPIFIPISMLAFMIYCLPIVFLTCRIVIHMFRGSSQEKRERLFHKSIKTWEAEKLIDHINTRAKHAKKNFYCSINLKRTVTHFAIALMSVLTIYSAMLMISEVAGYLIEILCFTLMGLIVNASKVLKYGSLMFLVVIYSYDTYNNVNKKYLKLNKALFSDIKFRIKDIEEHTSLPSHLQENRGFKACEASEQAEYELTDDIADDKKFMWDINDLILFIDSDDTPRIPKKLFDDTCQIQVAGNPGPVYRSLLAATGRFMAIILFLVFVFIVVMSFGEVYKISSTNQMLATLAGGFMPYIFRSLLRPEEPQVETGLVSFKSKLEEIIKNFCQAWPMYDFLFEVEEKPPPEEDSDDEDSSSTKSKDKNKKDKDRKISTASRMLKPAGSMEILDRSPSIIQEKELSIKEKIESMDLIPAEGGEVDILILISEKDRDWVVEWSSIGDINEVNEELNGLSRASTIKLGNILGEGLNGKVGLQDTRSRNNSTVFPPHLLT